MTFTVRGTLLSTPTPDRLQVREDHVVTIDDHGVIATVEPASVSVVADVTLPEGTYLLPGLIDLHVHAPQWPQLGTGLDVPLDEWLFQYTFPLEARYRDRAFAERIWASLVPGLLARGTTTAVYYSSIHEPATLALAEACVRFGQRAFVGRVAMDHPEGTPEFYRDADAITGVEASARSLEAINGLGSPLVRGIITPRFIPACTDALLEGLGELATATGALVQSHCSENDWEHQYVLDRFGVSDSVALARFGLARDHSVLAHGCLLSDDDMTVLARVGAGVAHCPLSNVYFGNAVFPVRRAMARGLRVGLGTDIAGGAEAGLLPVCAHAVNMSRVLEDGVDQRLSPAGRGVSSSAIDVTTAFWLATGGGADVLGIPAGRLEVGERFDAISVATRPADRPGIGVSVWDLDDWPRVFEKIVRLATPADITGVWVDGVPAAGISVAG
ncbi:MAG: amidohydrolase family protein [Actinomycetota bacterium]|nr:amidohydrolase family protein [Actinomycetota bacterium]